MECSQHTTQSKQPVSGKKSATEHLYPTLHQEHIEHNAAPPGKGRDSVKLTALSTVIPETLGMEKGAQLLATPTNAQNSTKMEASKTI